MPYTTQFKKFAKQNKLKLTKKTEEEMTNNQQTDETQAPN